MTEQMGVTLFRLAAWVYLIAAVCYIASFINRQRAVGKLGFGFLMIGLCLHTVSLVVVTAAIRRPPFLNLYEYLYTFTWGIAVVYTVLETKTKTQVFGTFAVPLLTVAAFVTYERLPGGIDQVVMPALNSVWKYPHVGTAILAYSAFTIAFGLALVYLVQEKTEGKSKSFWGTRLPSVKTLDQAIYRTIAFGFLMQTALVLFGAVWAQFAWGRYWGWDPKETWSLITWLIYAAYLHTRATMGWRGRRSAIVAIVGFAAVIFTLIGVSYLMSGLHSYA